MESSKLSLKTVTVLSIHSLASHGCLVCMREISGNKTLNNYDFYPLWVQYTGGRDKYTIRKQQRLLRKVKKMA